MEQIKVLTKLYILVKHKRYDSKETVSLSNEDYTIKIVGYKIIQIGSFAFDSTK